MLPSTTQRRGLRARLLFTFGLLVLAFSFFSGIVFLNVERASLEMHREKQVRERFDMLMAEAASPAELQQGARLLGLSAFAWRDLRISPAWNGQPPYPWHAQAGEQRHVDAARSWYGRVPISMQLEGYVDTIVWRAEVDLSDEAAILENTSRVLALYLFLNTALLLLIGAIWLSLVVIRPLQRLADGMASVRETKDARPLPVSRWDEIGHLTHTFNKLMERIAKAETKNREYVTRLENAYTQLEEAQERLLTSEKLASLGRLSAGIAHEIGNPLSAIRGYLELLKSSGDETERADLLQRTQAEADRVDRIIKGLLNFARSGNGDDARVEATPFLRQIIEGIRVQAAFKDVAIEAEIPDALPVISSAGGRLEQVLVNLCINAADAMGGKGTLALRAETSARTLSIAISDTGPGIAAEDLPHIFEPFFTTKPAGQGTGLGLAISHQIVESIGGRIRVSSEIGAGATFVVEVPATEESVRA